MKMSLFLEYEKVRIVVNELAEGEREREGKRERNKEREKLFYTRYNQPLSQTAAPTSFFIA